MRCSLTKYFTKLPLLLDLFEFSPSPEKTGSEVPLVPTSTVPFHRRTLHHDPSPFSFGLVSILLSCRDLSVSGIHNLPWNFTGVGRVFKNRVDSES